MMTAGVIDEDTDGSIITADVNCLSLTENLAVSCEKYIILNEVKGQGEESLFLVIRSWTGSSNILIV